MPKAHSIYQKANIRHGFDHVFSGADIHFLNAKQQKRQNGQEIPALDSQNKRTPDRCPVQQHGGQSQAEYAQSAQDEGKTVAILDQCLRL